MNIRKVASLISIDFNLVKLIIKIPHTKQSRKNKPTLD
jgi:hypothetical protein